jgi:hypothetical protein
MRGNTLADCPVIYGTCQSTSVLNDILNLVKARIDATGCLPTCVLRKRPTTLDTDKFPLIVVAPLDGEIISDQAFGYIIYKYPICVSLVQIGNRQYTKDLEKDLVQRETLRQVITGITMTDLVWDTDIDMFDPLYIPINGSAGTYQVNTFIANYKTFETRPNLN